MDRRDVLKLMSQGALLISVGGSLQLIKPKPAIGAAPAFQKYTKWPITILANEFPGWRLNPEVPGFALRGPLLGGPNEPAHYFVQYLAYCPHWKSCNLSGLYCIGAWPEEENPPGPETVSYKVFMCEMTIRDMVKRHMLEQHS